MTRRHSRDDTGAALIIVLVIVTVLSVSLAALLSLTDTSIRTTVNLRGQAAGTYEADGAVDAAITTIRNSTYNASAGTHCFGGADTIQVPLGADSAAVTCSPDPQKVLIQCRSLSSCNRPGSAILTLGRNASEEGLRIEQPNRGSTFRVHGTIFSNSNIDVVNGVLNTNTRVYARGACAGTIQSTPAPFCNYGTGANPLGDDPGYPPAVTAPPAYQQLPSCTRANSVVTFLPGYYDDAYGLTAMMAGNSACKHSTWWFKPGTYYFDFHNTGADANPLLNSTGGNVWTVDDGTLVAGTPVDGSGAVIGTPAVPATIPGSCDNPINDAHAVGVQFIFGGDSQLAVKSGQVEICGTYSANKPPVAIYGLTSGTATTTSYTAKLTGVPNAGGYRNATVANLSDVDGTGFGSWTSGQPNDSTTLTVNGYAPPSAIPSGSLLKSAAVRVVHRHANTSSADSVSVSVTPSGATALTAGPAGGTGGTAFRTDTFPLDAAATGALAKAVYGGTFTGATIAVTTKLPKNNDTEDIDSVQLDLSYLPPAFRAGTGCVTAMPYSRNGTGVCAVVSALNNSGNQFYIQGTTYAPGAVVDLTLNNVAEEVFRFGVIARSVWVKLTGSLNYTGPVIEVPDDSPGFVFSVYLTAYVCPGTSTCAAAGSAVLRAKVAFIDADPVNPVPGQRQVSVLSWTPPG